MDARLRFGPWLSRQISGLESRGTRAQLVAAHPEAPARIAELVRREGFELSPIHRIAIWHGGYYVEAAGRLDAIVQWLSGAAVDQALAPR